MERVVAKELARDINDTVILPANQGGAAAFTLIMMCRKAYGGKNKRCLWQSISRMHATESISSCWWTCSCSMVSGESWPGTDPIQCMHQVPGRSESNWTQQMTGSNRKHRGTPRRQPKRCSNNWITYPRGITESHQSKQGTDSALLTTEQQAKRWQWSDLIEL